MENYTINDIAMMTGLTTRTIRNYIKLGILNGEKEDGVWRFSAEDCYDFMEHPAVKSSIRAKKKAIVLDFLVEDKKKQNQICSILDLCIDEEESQEVLDFFCTQVNESGCENVRFSYERNGRNSRIIISGYEDAVAEILGAYYR